MLLARPEIASELSEKLADPARRADRRSREGLDEASKHARKASERERILGGIKEFFGL